MRFWHAAGLCPVQRRLAASLQRAHLTSLHRHSTVLRLKSTKAEADDDGSSYHVPKSVDYDAQKSVATTVNSTRSALDGSGTSPLPGRRSRSVHRSLNHLEESDIGSNEESVSWNPRVRHKPSPDADWHAEEKVAWHTQGNPRKPRLTTRYNRLRESKRARASESAWAMPMAKRGVYRNYGATEDQHETLKRELEALKRDREALEREREFFEKERSIDQKERELREKERRVEEKEREMAERERRMNMRNTRREYDVQGPSHPPEPTKPRSVEERRSIKPSRSFPPAIVTGSGAAEERTDFKSREPLFFRHLDLSGRTLNNVNASSDTHTTSQRSSGEIGEGRESLKVRHVESEAPREEEPRVPKDVLDLVEPIDPAEVPTAIGTGEEAKNLRQQLRSAIAHARAHTPAPASASTLTRVNHVLHPTAFQKKERVLPSLKKKERTSPTSTRPSPPARRRSRTNVERKMTLKQAMTGKDDKTTTDNDPADPNGKQKSVNIETVNASETELTPLTVEQPPVPHLFHGLDRVLFNQGVYQLQDPHSMVYNFDPYLQKIMPVTEFDFNALAEYKTSSQDGILAGLAREHNIKYVGSTSSMTSALGHFHYLLSNWRPLNLDMLSKGFPESSTSFTQLNQTPNAIFLRKKNGTYAIDADKEHDGANVLMLLGKSLEKLLTMNPDDFERYRKSDPRQISEAERNAPESFHFSTQGDFLMRSQLDAHDPRLPGTGMFDLKTRAVVTIRMQADEYEEMSGYEVHKHQGHFESYEREYYDMMRSTMLKYSLQARMGRMDGIFVAYHNVKRMFGFQYLSLNEMDRALHGQTDRCLGNQEFSLSIDLLNKILNKATERYPDTSLRFHFETRPSATLPFMYIFAEPMGEEEIDTIQNSQKAKIKEFERSVMGIAPDSVDAPKDTTIGDGNVIEDHDPSAATGDSVDELASEVVEIESGLVQDPNADQHESLKAFGGISNIPRGIGNDKPTPFQINTGSLTMTGKSPESTTEGSEPASSNSDDQVGDHRPTLSSKPSAEQENVTLISGDAKTEEENLRPLLAMTLTVRSRVNGKYVERPKDLTPSSKWSVEYSLSEITSPSRAWALYAASKARRKKIYDRLNSNDSKSGEDDVIEEERQVTRKKNDYYLQLMRELSAKGRELRREIDEIEQHREKVVVGEPYSPLDGNRMTHATTSTATNPTPVDSEVDIKGVDDYMRWLYTSQKFR